VARGLNTAHKVRIIHGDLQADNIFLTLSDDVGATLVVVLGRPQGLPLSDAEGGHPDTYHQTFIGTRKLAAATPA
jgi:serine/threonine protein kinase